MKLELFKKLITVIPEDPNLGLTATEIEDRLFRRYPDPSNTAAASRARGVRRHLRTLSDKNLIEVAPNSQPRRYFVSKGAPRELLMSPDASLSLFWSRQILQPLMPVLGTEAATRLGIGTRLESTDRVLQERIRIVPDGIGRESAAINEEHLETVTIALRRGLMISITYGKSGGAPSELQVSILGLAVKDGTIYLIASESMTAAPRHFPMQRIRSLELLRRPADQRLDFDLDRYIADQYQLSHKLDSTAPPSRLELLVHKDALFHFEERPLINQEPIDKTTVIDGVWYRVHATVPDTVQLAPFLWSHAGWVQVLAPASVRRQVAEGLRAGASRYLSPNPAEENR